jgi:hypothetical protein
VVCCPVPVDLRTNPALQSGIIGPVIVEGDRLWELLRSLDDPAHLEFPADFNRDETKNRRLIHKGRLEP